MITPFIRALLLIATIIPQLTYAQLLTDEAAKNHIKQGMDKLYNMEFTEADQHFQKVKNAYINHPVGELLHAIQIQWQNMPVEKNPIALNKYLTALEKSKKQAENLYKEGKYKEEATFFLIATYGYIALSYNYQKEYSKAVLEAKQAYGYLKEGMKYKNPDFLFTTGLYNFYRIQYPETHPVVKPVMLFFEGGNKALGLQQLESAIQKATFSREEAAIYLTNIYLKYQNDRPKALHTAAYLGKKYPNNKLFTMRYAETLLLNGQFTEAEKQIDKLKNTPSNSLYWLAIHTFEGILAEIRDKDKPAAMQHYQKAAQMIADRRYTSEYKGLAYLGLARNYSHLNQPEKAKLYAKKCQEIAEYHWVIEEAKQWEKKSNR